MSHRIGSTLCYHILKFNGKVESRTTVQHVTQDDYALPGAKECIQRFDDNLIECLKDDNFTLSEGEDPIYGVEDVIDSIEDNNNIDFLEENDLNMNRAIECDDYSDEAYDALLTAELQLPNNNADGFMRGTVIKRAKNNIGQPIGTQYADANLDTRMYVVCMVDGHEKELQHNLIATNMFTQTDSEGR